jgi:hypothetical protein
VTHSYREQSKPNPVGPPPTPAFQSASSQGPVPLGLSQTGSYFDTWHSFTAQQYADRHGLSLATAQAVLDQAIIDGILLDEGDS